MVHLFWQSNEPSPFGESLTTQPPPEDPKSLLLGDIKRIPELYQFRRPAEYASRTHIHEMARKVKDGQALEALLVWWGGDGWYCIDGHHRLDAYEVGRWPKKDPVPVQVHRGTVVSAMLRSVQSNAPTKLQMTKREQAQAAWELVVLTTKGEASAKAIALASTVSERQVFTMRATKRTLLQKEPERDLTEISWPRARSEADGKEMDENKDWDAAMEEEAKQLAGKLMQLLGHRFPLLVSGASRQLTASWSQWWGRYLRKEVKITDSRKVFHSFRHGFKDACRDSDIPKELNDRLTGHGGGGVGDSYGADDYPLRPLADAMNKLRYRGLDLAHLAM